MAKKNLVQIPAQIIDLRPRQDRSWKISFESRELTPEEVAVLAANFQGEGWLAYKPNGEIAMDEIPDTNAESGVKSQTQRMRSVIYLDWKQHGEPGDFESYYRTYYEKLIEYGKSKLSKEDNT